MSTVPPVTPPVSAGQVGTTSLSLEQKVDALIAKVDTYIKGEEAKAVTTVKSFFTKHWPWMVGVATGLSRFVHL